MARTPIDDPKAKLDAELRRAVVRAAARSYDDLNGKFFRWQLLRPPLRLAESSRRLGAWTKKPRGIELSEKLLLEHDWGALVEVLKHEMAHQFVDEVLGISDEGPHGKSFRKVCAERGFDMRAVGVPSPSGDGPEAPVLERIAKLLALAESPNQHEAESAMNAAQRLMLRHNLEGVEAGRPRDYGFRHLGKPTGRINEAERIIAVILSEHFFVDVIWVPVWRPLEGKRGSVLEICGSPENLELAEYVYGFLLHTAEALWKAHKREHAIRGNRDRRAFVAGVVSGFREKLREEQRKQTEQGLVWVGDAELAGYFKTRHPNVRTTRHRSSAHNLAHVEGRSAGRKIVLHKGVSTGSSGNTRLLKG